MNDETAIIAVDPAAGALSVQQVLNQVSLMQQIMGAAMKDGEHYGKIPGCGDKPTLLKPGAEKLCLTFRLAPTYEVEEKIGERGHREYRVQCALTSILSGAFIGQGVGICSTMEAKYRFRSGKGEATDKPVPRAYWDVRQEDPAKAQELIGGKGFSPLKVEGKGWMIAKGGDKVEHDNPADHYNTVLKIGKKRALVDAVLTATAASDIFTQDLEDIQANMATYASAASVVDTRQPIEAGKSTPRTEATPGAPYGDFRETRIHFGKNRGLMLSELTPQQVHWYEEDWLPKKEVNGPTSAEDLALINALKAYREWRGSGTNLKARGGQAQTTNSKTLANLETWDGFIQDVSADGNKGWKAVFLLANDQQPEAMIFNQGIADRAQVYSEDNVRVTASVHAKLGGGFEVISLDPVAETGLN